MQETYLDTRSGEKTILCNSRFLHSKYDPYKESVNFLKKNLSRTPETLVIIGESLGYLHKAAKELFPKKKIISLYINREMMENSSSTGLTWSPGREPLSSFLARHVAEYDIHGLRSVIWPPAKEIYKDLITQWGEELRSFLLYQRNHYVTTSTFGRRWLENLCDNYLTIEKFYAPPTIRKPIVIAASGSSLSKSISTLKKKRELYHLWSLPSSLKFFSSHGITPDFIISTDPGYHARFHYLHAPASGTLFLPLTAQRIREFSVSKKILFAQNSLWERIFFQNTSLALSMIPENGTVAGTALEAALLYGMDTIYLLGLDLCFYDLLSHVSPHTFEPHSFSRISRVTPFESLLYHNAMKQAPQKQGQSRRGSSLDAYASWFNDLPEAKKTRIVRVAPSVVSLPGIREGSLNGISADSEEGKVVFDSRPHILPDLKTKKEELLRFIDFIHDKLSAIVLSEMGSTGDSLLSCDILYYLAPLQFRSLLREKQESTLLSVRRSIEEYLRRLRKRIQLR